MLKYEDFHRKKKLSPSRFQDLEQLLAILYPVFLKEDPEFGTDQKQ